MMFPKDIGYGTLFLIEHFKGLDFLRNPLGSGIFLSDILDNQNCLTMAGPCAQLIGTEETPKYRS